MNNSTVKRPARNSFALPASDMRCSPLGDMDRADGARLRRCAHGAAKTLAVRPHARRLHASPLRARPCERRTLSPRAIRRADSVGDMDRADGARLRRCAHGAAKAPAVRPHARRVPASPLISCPCERRTLSPRAIRRFVPRSATWTERMVRVSDVARMARPKLRRCAHARRVPASPLISRPARNSFTHQASDSPR